MSLSVIFWQVWSFSAIRAISSAKSRSVSLLLLCQLIPKSGLSMALFITKSIAMIKRKGDKMHPYLAPDIILIGSVVPVEVFILQVGLS